MFYQSVYRGLVHKTAGRSVRPIPRGSQLQSCETLPKCLLWLLTVWCRHTATSTWHQLACRFRLRWNVMAHTQKPDFVFRRNGRVHLNRRGRQFSRLLAAEVCASAVVMLDTPRSEVVWEYWLPTPFASFPFTSSTVPSGFKLTIHAALPIVLAVWSKDYTNRSRSNIGLRVQFPLRQTSVISFFSVLASRGHILYFETDLRKLYLPDLPINKDASK